MVIPRIQQMHSQSPKFEETLERIRSLHKCCTQIFKLGVVTFNSRISISCLKVCCYIMHVMLWLPETIN